MSTAIFYPLFACFRVLASAFGSHRLIVNGASLSPTEIDTMKSFCFRFSLLGKQRSTREATFLLNAYVQILWSRLRRCFVLSVTMRAYK